jgi:hypothetical protein
MGFLAVLRLTTRPARRPDDATDADEHLVHMPGVTRTWPPPPELASKVSSEPDTPLADTLVGHPDPPLGQDQFDVTQTQAEHMVEPNRVADDLRRETVARLRHRGRRHQISLSDPGRSANW